MIVNDVSRYLFKHMYEFTNAALYLYIVSIEQNIIEIVISEDQKYEIM